MPPDNMTAVRVNVSVVVPVYNPGAQIERLVTP